MLTGREESEINCVDNAQIMAKSPAKSGFEGTTPDAKDMKQLSTNGRYTAGHNHGIVDDSKKWVRSVLMIERSGRCTRGSMRPPFM